MHQTINFKLASIIYWNRKQEIMKPKQFYCKEIIEGINKDTTSKSD